MSRGVLGKNNWALVLLILVGVVLGGLIGKLCAGVPALSWLSYGHIVYVVRWNHWWDK